MIQVPATVALILCIVGATSADNPADIISETTVHVGIILFTAVLAALVLLTGLAAVGRKKTARGEKSLIVAVALALPFLAVRTIYGLLAAFSNDRRFEPGTGSTTISLLMEVLPEMAIVFIYLIVGVKSPALPREEDHARSAGSKIRRGGFTGAKFGLLSMAVHAGREAYNSKNQSA